MPAGYSTQTTYHIREQTRTDGTKDYLYHLHGKDE